ncbi:unnamed protein product, partial [Didymodactylos carnosus]
PKSLQLFEFGVTPSPLPNTVLTNEECIGIYSELVEVKSINSNNWCQCKQYTFKVNDIECVWELDKELTYISHICVKNAVYDGKKCICNPGYRSNQNRRSCDRIDENKLQLDGADNPTGKNLCTTYTDTDCRILYNSPAYCDTINKTEICLCDRKISFVYENKCERFAHYVYPALRELPKYTCDADDDCNRTLNTVCSFYLETNYKVCQCQKDYLYNPANKTCENNRCKGNRAANTNYICNGYDWVCKNGYYPSKDKTYCEPRPTFTDTYQYCNSSYILATSANGIQCNNTCERTVCMSGYKNEHNKCVRNNFNDKCEHDQTLCSTLVEGSTCVDNVCGCYEPGTYKNDVKCAKAVGFICDSDTECDDNSLCLQHICRCKDRSKLVSLTDSDGRRIERCINGGRTVHLAIGLLLLMPLLWFIRS